MISFSLLSRMYQTFEVSGEKSVSVICPWLLIMECSEQVLYIGIYFILFKKIIVVIMESTDFLDPRSWFLFLGASGTKRTCPLTLALVVFHIPLIICWDVFYAFSMTSPMTLLHLANSGRVRTVTLLSHRSMFLPLRLFWVLSLLISEQESHAYSALMVTNSALGTSKKFFLCWKKLMQLFLLAKGGILPWHIPFATACVFFCRLQLCTGFEIFFFLMSHVFPCSILYNDIWSLSTFYQLFLIESVRMTSFFVKLDLSIAQNSSFVLDSVWFLVPLYFFPVFKCFFSDI